MKFSVITLGCKVNYCESAEIAYSMIKAGFEKVDPEDSPDVVIINSCAVTGTGVKKAERIISKFKSLNTGTVIVLCGCFPQAYSEQAYGTSADIVLGNALKYSAAEFVKRFLENGEPIRAAGELTNDFLMLSDQAPSDFDRTRAFIKIEDGCDNFCSYCIIPFARGRIRSAPVEYIKKAAENAVNEGHKEIVLTGINLSCYGRDIGLTLGDAVRAANVKGISRIRLGSVEADMITDSEILKFKEVTALCPHFHLSLQSGSDAVLKRMHRRYDTEFYAKTVDKLRKEFPKCSVTTDIIVGFPGETDKEFQETLNFAERMKFAKIHVFPYSIRRGTVAATRPDQVLPQIKNERVCEMERLSKKLIKEFIAGHKGLETEVLIEKDRGIDYSFGYTKDYLPVRIYEKLPQFEIVKTVIKETFDGYAEGTRI